MATIDDVFILLNAVNVETLGRVEGEIKDLQSQILGLASAIDSLFALLNAVNQTTLGRMEAEVMGIDSRLIGLQLQVTDLQTKVQNLVSRP